jgi:hypothetical protein
MRKARASELVNARSQRHRSRKRAADPTLYKQQVRNSKKVWAEKNPDKVLKIGEKALNKAKEDHRFYCVDCEVALATALALESHSKSLQHLERVVGIPKAHPHPHSASNALHKMQRINAKEFHCSPCDKSFPNQWSLSRHVDTNLHKKRLEKQIRI